MEIIETVAIRELGTVDDKYITALSKLHMAAFPEFFLTQLGLPFLKSLYRGYMEDENSGIIVAEIGGCPVGFIAYSNDYSKFYKDLLKNHEISSLLKDDKENLAKFMKFKEGGDIFTTIIASILAVNVITPIIRNKIASFFHNNSLEKEKEKQNQEKQETFKTKNVKNLDIKEGVNEINSKPSFENLNKQLVTPLNQKKQNPFENGSLQSTFATNSLWS